MTNTVSYSFTAALFGAVLLLSACGDSAPADSEVTETVLGDIDVLEGSASDEMITVDEFDGDTPPAQGEVAAEEGAKGAEGEGDNSDDGNASEGANTDAAANGDEQEGDTVVRPRSSAPANDADNGPDNADTGV